MPHAASTDADCAVKETATKHDTQRPLLALRAITPGLRRNGPRNRRKRFKKWLAKTAWIVFAIVLQYALNAL
jgi:hypothetical protein